MRRVSSAFASFVLLVLVACGSKTSEAPPTTDPDEGAAAQVETQTSPQDLFWEQLTTLCGKAFAGAMVSSDEVDADFADQEMTMHVRRCAEDRIEIPFHVGENRSRTWVLSRLADGLQLQHDHRHEDGHEDTVTLYGGRTAEVGDAGAQHFPADDFSKRLFLANGLDASVANVWTFELAAGERFSYILRRPERHFQADFDLRTPVPEPPAPWGH